MSTIIPFPGPNPIVIRNDHELRERRELARRERTAKIDLKIRELRDATRTSDGNCNRQLAKNLGQLIVQRGRVHSEKPTALIRRVFQTWEKESGKQEDRAEDWLLQKRKRWVRLPREFEDAPVSMNKDRFASRGADFVRLAEIVAKLTRLNGLSHADNERDAMFVLLSNTRFDPDPSGVNKSGVRSKPILYERLKKLHSTVLQAVPELPWYFRVVSEGGLFHDSCEQYANGNHFDWEFAVFREDSWGNLYPEALYDGHDLAEEGSRIAGLLPYVPLVDVTIRREYPAADCPNPADLATCLFPGDPRAPRGPDGTVAMNWRVHLALAPFGGVEPEDLKFCIIGVPGHANPLPLAYSGRQWLAAEDGKGVAIDLGNEPDPDMLRLSGLDSQLWLADGLDGTWLLAGLQGEPVGYEGVSTPRVTSRSTCQIKPCFDTPVFGPSERLPPQMTIIGMLERHFSDDRQPSRLDTKLVYDAKRRVSTLKSQIATNEENR